MSAIDPSALHVLLLAGAIEARGTSAYTLRLARRLLDHGIAATLVTPHARRVDFALRRQVEIAEDHRLDSAVWGAFVARCLLRDRRDRTTHLVHIESPKLLRLGQWLARQLECPCVLTVHAPPAACTRLHIDRRVCRRLIAASETVHDELLARGIAEGLVTTIVSGVDIDRELDLPVPLAAGHVPVVGTAGPLEALEGLPYLIGAARRVLAELPEIEFLIAGAGPEEGNLRRVARELGVSQHLTFVPYGLDFSAALAAMDIFCLPAVQQGLSTTMLEAMALARPVIASSVDGVSTAIRDRQTGLVVPPRNTAELAERILELLRNPALARELGAAGRNLILREFDADRTVLQTAELYREVCVCPLKSSPLAPS